MYIVLIQTFSSGWFAKSMVRNSAAIDWFAVSVTDITRRDGPSVHFQNGTDLVAFGACPADTLADYDLFAYICLFTSKRMDTKVVLIGKASSFGG